MIDRLATAIETLLVTAPGNADEEANDGVLWDSTVSRLGVSTESEARNRVYNDLFESEDVAPERPFFVIVETDVHWQTPASNAWSGSSFEVFYSERAYDPDASNQDDPVGEGLAHKRSKSYFSKWVGELMANCADRIGSEATAKIDRIELVIPPQRTPREFRDPDDIQRDYWWTCWRWTIGTGVI